MTENGNEDENDALTSLQRFRRRMSECVQTATCGGRERLEWSMYRGRLRLRAKCKVSRGSEGHRPDSTVAFLGRRHPLARKICPNGYS